MPPARLEQLQERTRYDPSEVEGRVFRRWEEAGIFHPQPEGDAAESFSIALPPPNVTGALHMGHALNGSIQDALIRLKRMQGRRTKWILGTDHAGIATQVQVEKRLESEGTSRTELGRDEFNRRVWEWRERYGGQIVEQYRRLGASLDYEDERFTMDEQYVRAVQRVFVALYEKGYVYRDNYMVNWDPGTRSAISDLEVEQRTVEDTLYRIEYPLEGGSGSITIATVRPETILADTAIAVHPDDERYTRLIGEHAILPLVGRRLPIVADSYVDPEFGTGALKITPGHDPNDFEIGRTHGLEEITAIGEDGRMSAAAGPKYEGLDVDEARNAVVADLRAEGRISGSQPFVHDVPHSHRSGRRIEPLISLQWFCDMTELAKPAIAAARDGSLRFHPERPHTQVYLTWLESIRPWCISRQLWWGHQLPVWYRGEETYVGETPPEGEGWERDPDVLDTWFSSALWPFATLGWPEETPELRAFYPTDVLVTGRDIIFLWVARMVMMGIEFTGELPFADVPINSIIQAPDGRRMSKSLGTGIDPLELVDSHGADALRFGLLAMSSSQDARFNEERVKQGADLANKLWNASRLVLLRVEDVEPGPRTETIEDRWIVSRVERLTERVTEHYESFTMAHAARELYDGFWTDVCDWYLELAKPRLYDEAGDRSSVSATLLWVLERSLTLLHPVMPFVTEEIWSYMPGERGLLAVAPWPAVDEDRFDDEAEEVVGRAIEAVTALRRYREQVGAAAGAKLRARLAAPGYEETAGQIARLARLDLSGDDSAVAGGGVGDGDPAASGEPVAAVAIPGGSVQVLESDGVSAEDEQRRRSARREQLVSEIARAEAKLANEGFVRKAPAEVVQGERDKLERLRGEAADLDR
jgi:valyl-tRNA synthetase